MNKTLSIIAVLLAAVALWTAASKKGAQTRDAIRSPDDLAPRFEDLQREHQALQQAHTALMARLMELERARPADAGAPTDMAQLQQRIKDLEAKQTQLAEFTRDLDKYGVIATMEKELVNAYSALMDTNQSVTARLKHVGQLRRYGYYDDKAQAVVTGMYHESQNLNERGSVLDAMKGSVPREFRDQIIADLNADIAAGNQSTRFRYYAIEALEPMLPDPTVQQWLGHLAQSDPEPKLAARAGQAVGIAPMRIAGSRNTMTRRADLRLALLALSVTAWVPVVRAQEAPPQVETTVKVRGPFYSGNITWRSTNDLVAMKGIVLTVGDKQDAFVCYDTELVALSLGWIGDGKQYGLATPRFSAPLPRVVGTVTFGTRRGPGWAKDGSFTDMRDQSRGPLPRGWAHHQGLYVHGRQVVLKYSVGATDLLELPGFDRAGGVPVFTRTIQPLDRTGALMLDVAYAKDAQLSQTAAGLFVRHPTGHATLFNVGASAMPDGNCATTPWCSSCRSWTLIKSSACPSPRWAKPLNPRSNHCNSP
ncbi:MAG: hypothetical protein HC814_05250, partial [Rhodobacteraceae bacterium]|nr:hypothetical protein [Paracoccaceae bacterium]